MLDKFRAALTALNKGEELTHAAAWKNRQTLTNLLVALLGAVSVFLPDSLHLSADDAAALATAVAIVAGLFNSYLSSATSARVGLPPIGGNTDDSGRANDHG